MEDIIANTVNTYKNENMPEDSLRIKAYNNVYSFSGKPNGILFTSLFEKYWQGNIQDTINEKHGRGNNFEETDFLSVPVLTQSATASRDALPSSYSLRQYAPPVGNQGEYSTCTAWASAYATRTIAFAVSHGYSVNNGFDKIISNTFSPDFVYNNVQPSGDCSLFASLRKSLAFMADKGALLKKRDIFVCGTAYMNNDFDTAKNYRIMYLKRINDPLDSEQALIFKVKTLLVNKNAIAFGMHTPDSFTGRLESGIWLPTEADYKTIDSVRKKLLITHDGHAMCLIGYNDDISGGSFEVMNSWGTNYGNKGFYWVNYHDFYLFVTEMYTLNDFGAVSTNVANAVAKADSSTKAQPIIIASATSASNTPALVAVDTKPRLKGDMELLLMKPDRSFENIDVSERIVNANGEIIDITPATVNGYASFNVAKPLFSGNRYKIKFTLSQAAYIYLLSKDEKNNYTRLFPQKERNESPLINFTNATLFLPNEKQNYSLDDTPGKDKMCVLLSKSPIDIKALDELVAQAGNNIYQTVRNNLAGRLIEINNVKYTNDNKIFFDSEVNDNNVLAFFIEINHL
jgi:C1A family cysteine protease